MNTTDLFHHYAATIANLPSSFDIEQPLPASLRISGDARHAIYYAPFDHVNTGAKVVLVGITPGRVQAIEAIRTAARCLQDGLGEVEARARAKMAQPAPARAAGNLVRIRVRCPAECAFCTSGLGCGGCVPPHDHPGQTRRPPHPQRPAASLGRERGAHRLLPRAQTARTAVVQDGSGTAGGRAATRNGYCCRLERIGSEGSGRNHACRVRHT